MTEEYTIVDEKQPECNHKVVREMRSGSIKFKCVKCGAESAFMNGIELEEIKKPKER